MTDCKHEHIADPPVGKMLRICLDCCKRLIECDRCDAVTTARPDIAASGWTKGGFTDAAGNRFAYSHCPEHACRAHD